MRSTLLLVGLFSFFFFGSGLIERSFAQTGAVRGAVTEKGNRLPLPGATVVIEGTTMGNVTDIDGRYRISNVPQGTYNLVVSYLGYISQTIQVTVAPNEISEQNFSLSSDSQSLSEVEVVGQASGQLAAINEQLRSNTIVSVVSRDKIQELPDQNAAETVGRLPGISVQRENGEGQKVVVRGLSPKFNSITINGERIPSTDEENRSVDLSMISPESLGGIEVFKALRPDMDADAIGGTVNFVVKKAADREVGGFKVQGGYNQQMNEYGQWKADVFYGNRFLDKRLGLFASVNGQRANRSSDNLSADYALEGVRDDGTPITDIQNLNLADRLEVRRRYSGTLNLDYQLSPDHSLLLSNSLGYIDRDEETFRKRFRVADAYLEYDYQDRRRNTLVLSNSIQGTHQFFKWLELVWRGSVNQSQQVTEYDHSARFRELGAFNSALDVRSGPQGVPPGADYETEATFLKDARYDDSDIMERSQTGQVDLRMDTRITDDWTGYFKFGVKYRALQRERGIDRVWTGTDVRNIIPTDQYNRFQLTPGGSLSILNAIDPNGEANDFLRGAYGFGIGTNESNGPILNGNWINDFYNQFGALYTEDARVDLQSYQAGEDIGAAYLMTQQNISEKLMIMGGVRTEHTWLDYRALTGRLVKLENEEWQVQNPVEEINEGYYNELLPMLHVKLSPLQGFDVRMAYTQTLARPSFFNLVPYVIIDDQNRTARLGNPDLQHAVARNYDLFLTYFSEKFGLFTIGGFYKEIDRVEYIANFRETDPDSPLNTYFVEQPRNAVGISLVRGVEFDYQGNLRWLPSPFNGLVISANMTLLQSRTYYQFFEVVNTEIPEPPFVITTTIDGEREGTLPGQPDIIGNISLGWENKRVSARISMVHQGNALFSVGERPEADVYTVATTRYDAAVNVKVNKHFTVFANMNNITNMPERAFFGDERFFTNEEYFGFTADLGFRYRL